MRLLILFCLLAGWAGAVPAHALEGAPPRRPDSVHQRLAEVGPSNGPGCALGIARGGVLDYAGAHGMADLEHRIAISPRTVFHAGSLAKQFTAFSILLLAEDGELSLDDDIREHLPEMPDYGAKITVRHLMHHTSGLREQGQLLYLAGWRSDDVMTQDDMLGVLRKQRGLNFQPGAEIGYVNAGYTLLAEIVRRTSGKPLRVFAEERIFRPLGMTDTRFRDDHTQVLAGRALAYRPAESGWRLSVPAFGHHGSTNLSTTVLDLLRWQQNLMDGRVGGRKLMGEMRRSGRLNDGVETGYGGGLNLGRYRGLPVMSHDGADHGYRADALIFPDQQLAIAALCNSASADASALTRVVADLRLAGHLQPETWSPAAMPAGQTLPPAGVYWSPQTDEVVEVESRNGALHRRGGQQAFTRLADGTFGVKGSPERWRFGADASGPSLSVTDYWPTSRAFRYLGPRSPAADDPGVFAGRYRSSELGTTYEVKLERETLTLLFGRGVAIPLEPVHADRFVSAIGVVTFERSASGRVEALTISNRRLRRFRIERFGGEQPASPLQVAPTG